MQGKTLPEYFDGYIRQIDKRKNRTEPEFPTGIKFVDELTDGMQKGQVWTISAKTAFGKTTLAVQIARNLADSHKNVLFVSLEMQGEELVGRMFCEMMRQDNQLVKRGEYNPQYADTFLKYLQELNMEICENGYSFEELLKIIKSYYPTKKPDAVFIDFAQLIGWEQFKDQRLAMESYMRKLTELAKKENIAIVIVSQLRRMPSGSDYNREPDISDMKGTAILEQLSYVCILIYKEITSDSEKVILKVAKNRGGGTGKQEMRFIGSQYRFAEIEENLV